jgi:hypothetical protein
MKKLSLSLMIVTSSLFFSEKGYSREEFEGCVPATATSNACTCGEKIPYRGKTIKFNDPLCKDEVGRPNGCYCEYKN